MSVTPYIRIPLTDVTGSMISHQFLGRCAKQEEKFMDCMEAYGVGRGVNKCRMLYDDYAECNTMDKQFKRFIAIHSERQRQIKAGKLQGEEKYVNPRIDSY